MDTSKNNINSKKYIRTHELKLHFLSKILIHKTIHNTKGAHRTYNKNTDITEDNICDKPKTNTLKTHENETASYQYRIPNPH